MIRALLAVLLLAGFTQDQKASLEGVGVVRVQYVDSTHWALAPKQLAKALRTEDGQKWILINLDGDQDELQGWLMHEYAHLIAWDRYGERIQEHGPEFRRVCRQLVTHRTNYFCKGG
ncbi:MAG: SprT-like domain-containing protein [Pseudomonadota bacterium]